LASDKARDLAVIKIHGKNLRALSIGDSDQVQIGEDVVAIGNPLGLELTVSNGILSGVRTDEQRGCKFLQVTAPISHGSSGGPLFNMAGEVIGITSMYLEGGENLNFAIPINDAKRLLQHQFNSLHQLPNETPAPAFVERQDAAKPPIVRKERRFGTDVVRAAIVAINGLGTSREKELLQDLRNTVDLEKDTALRDQEEFAYFAIVLESNYVYDGTKAFLDRVRQIMTARSLSMNYAMSLASDEPEYKAFREQRILCADTLKSQVRDGYIDPPQFCSDLNPLTAYRQVVLCNISKDECGAP